MLQLPNGCTCSDPSVFPKNWKTVSASCKKDWRIQYYFRDPDFKDRWPNGKSVIVKRMNRFKTVEERRVVTKMLLENEINDLKAGHNPILKKTIVEVRGPAFEINRKTPFIQAIRMAFKKLKLSDSSLSNISSSITYIEKASNKLGYSDIEVSKISRKHIISILEACDLSPQSYNHYRAYFMQLFTELVILEATEINPVDKYVRKMDVEGDAPELFTRQERKEILNFYKKNDKYFARFLQIFFHSGSREIELLRIKHEKVDPNCRFFKTKVRKRKKVVEEKRAIKKISANLWRELLEETNPGEYIFGRLLVPGPKPCLRDYITKKWKRDIKDGLGINKNIYWLKHTNLDETSAILDAKAAAKQAGHKSTVITLKHYLINEEDREMERLREVANKFA